ncbi:unnamed protein product, partial [Prorocentrum cordatum]
RSASKPPLQLTAAQQARIAADRAVARTRQEARAQERARSEHQSRAPWTAPGGSLRHEQEAEEEEPKHPDEGEAEEGDLVRFAPPPEPTKGGRDAPRARCRGGEGARAAAPSPPRRGLRGPLGAWATASTAAKQHSPALNVRPRRTKLPETRGRQSSATPEGLVCNRDHTHTLQSPETLAHERPPPPACLRGAAPGGSAPRRQGPRSLLPPSAPSGGGGEGGDDQEQRGASDRSVGQGGREEEGGTGWRRADRGWRERVAFQAGRGLLRRA